MKSFLTVAIVCCFVSFVTARPPPSGETPTEPPHPSVVTGATCLLQRTCTPVTALVVLGVAKAASDGVEKYKETADIFAALQTAAHSGFDNAAAFLRSATNMALHTAESSYGIAKDVYKGKDVQQAVIDRTTIIPETRDYLKEEFINNPKGTVSNAMVTGGNIAMTWAVGPLPAYISSALAKAAADGLQKYKETKDVAAAAKIAAESGYNSAAGFLYAAAGLVSTGAGLAKDITTGKNPKVAIKERGSQALGNIVDPMGTGKKSSTSSRSVPSSSKSGPPTNKGSKAKSK